MVTVFVEDKTYLQYVALLHKLNNNQRACKEEKASTKLGSFTASLAPSYSAGQPTFSADGLTPMALSALCNLSTPRPPKDQRYVEINECRKLAPAEKQWRMDNGRCGFCSEAGKTFPQCPASTQRGGRTFPLRGAVTTMTSQDQEESATMGPHHLSPLTQLSPSNQLSTSTISVAPWPCPSSSQCFILTCTFNFWFFS